MNSPAGNAPGEATKRGVRTNHGLYREAKTLQPILFRKRDSFEMFQERWTVIPRHASAAGDDVVSLERADRHALHVGNPELRREHQEIILQLAEDIFAIPGQIHFVDGSEHVGYSKEGCNEGLTARLGEDPFCSDY